ncbi:MAG: T9SS type A sorting domain-containing protein [Rhodothermaceae bacterium]|nr:T9SS type A sorting domain-containing protein [Rhodothermaceae bacterium]
MRTVTLCLLLTTTSVANAQFAFTDVTSGDLLTAFRSWSVSWVDVDGDGDLDLFASRFGATGGNLLFTNDGGTFTRVTGSSLTDSGGSIGHTWGDYDNDGDPDVLIAGGGTAGFGNTGGPSILYRNDGINGQPLMFTPIETGPFAPSENNLGWSAAWGDANNDGWLDAVIAHPVGFLQTNQVNHLILSNGDGTFSRVTTGPVVTGFDPYTVPAWSDYDLDGDVDLFIGSGPATGTPAPDNLYENDGTGAFTRITTAPVATDARDGQIMNWVDYDNDGDFDLFVTNYSSNVRDDLYRNDGGTYTQVTTEPPVTDAGGFSLANTWGDLDNDGDLDLFVTTDGAATDRLYMNNGDGTFTGVTGLPPVTTANATSGASLGDYDDDGDLDLAVTAIGFTGAMLRLYRNDLANGNASFKVNLIGLVSNRDGIGAKVRATATILGEAVTQLREVSAQTTFNGQNALTAHFGLGDATIIDELRIEWPSGQVDTYTAVDINAFADRFATAREGEGLVPVANEPEAILPNQTSLDAAFPNPFARTTTLRYTLATPSPITLAVYDVLGRRVAVVADGPQTAGPHAVVFEATDLPSGIYVIRLTHEAGTEARPLTLTR